MKTEDFKSFSLKMRPGFEGGPNVSTLLGSWNINTKKFRDTFEVKTQKLPEYFVMKLTVVILPSKELEFRFSNISLAYLFRLLSYNGFLKKKGPGGYVSVPVLAIEMKDFLKAVIYKFGEINDVNLRKAFGTLSSTLLIIKDKKQDLII